MKSEQNAESDMIGTYNAYLVRLWQESPEAPWRASATSVPAGKTVYFATLQALFSFLQARTVPLLHRPDRDEPTGESFP